MFVVRLIKSKGVLKATWWNIVNNVISLMRSAFVGILLARFLGASDYGEYTLLTSITTLLTNISHFGIDNIAIKDLARMNEDDKRDYIPIYSLIILLGSLISISVLIVYFVCFRTINYHEAFLVILLLMFQFLDVFRCNLIAIYRTKMMTIIRSSLNSICLMFCVMGIIYKENVIYFFIVYIITELAILMIPFLINAPNNMEYFRIHSRTINDGELKRLLLLAIPLWIGVISVSIYMKIDQVMIRSMLDSRQLGVYSVAVKISELWYFFPTILCTSFLPYFSIEFQKDIDLFWKKYEVFSHSVMLFSFLVAIFLTVFSDTIIYFLYGSEYRDSINIIKLYSWGGIFVSMGLVRTIFLTIKEYTMYSCGFSFVAAFTNVFLNLVLIPKIGVIGAAFATIISYAIQSYISNFLFNKLRRVSVIQTKGFIAPIFLFMNYRNYKKDRGIS